MISAVVASAALSSSPTDISYGHKAGSKQGRDPTAVQRSLPSTSGRVNLLFATHSHRNERTKLLRTYDGVDDDGAIALFISPKLSLLLSSLTTKCSSE